MAYIRLFALAIIAVCAGLIYYNWQQITTGGSYYPKMAVMAPVGVIGGLFMLLFPRKVGKPETTGDKVLVMLVFAIGLAAGAVNLYLMDPSFFGQ
ncbi:MAG TPA: hypothetical protein VFZ34_23130 [Blastocatellia bacterium]|nr:hypothetical protein [Blastocatellia bacterium]